MARPVVALHDARTLAALAGAAAPPACDLVAAPLDSPGTPLGAFVGGNPLAEHWAVDAELPGEWILAWSGTLGGSPFEGTPANWMRGPARLNEFCTDLAPQLARHGKRLVLVPHPRTARAPSGWRSTRAPCSSPRCLPTSRTTCSRSSPRSARAPTW
jgi:hypothetical protein